MATAGVPQIMVLNLGILKMTFPRPMRSDQWSAGPADVTRINAAMTAMGMAVRTSRKQASSDIEQTFEEGGSTMRSPAECMRQARRSGADVGFGTMPRSPRAPDGTKPAAAIPAGSGFQWCRPTGSSSTVRPGVIFSLPARRVSDSPTGKRINRLGVPIRSAISRISSGVDTGFASATMKVSPGCVRTGATSSGLHPPGCRRRSGCADCRPNRKGERTPLETASSSFRKLALTPGP